MFSTVLLGVVACGAIVSGLLFTGQESAKPAQRQPPRVILVPASPQPGTQSAPAAKDPFASLFIAPQIDLQTPGPITFPIGPHGEETEDVCGAKIRMLRADPNVDPKIHVLIPNQNGVNHKIRRITPPCAR
jgi:hypothetical protein